MQNSIPIQINFIVFMLYKDCKYINTYMRFLILTSLLYRLTKAVDCSDNVMGNITSNEYQVYLLTKQLRESGFTCPKGAHFPPNNKEFILDCRLVYASRDHSKDMACNNYFSHYSRDGTTPMERSERYGFSVGTENIAAGVIEPSQILNMWKQSDGHCINMMKENNNRMGIGYGYNSNSIFKHYWTELFGINNDVSNSCYIKVDPLKTTTVPPIPCKDQHKLCQRWRDSGYCLGKYQRWMEIYCTRSCRVC